MAERRTVDGSLALADKQVRVITIEAGRVLSDTAAMGVF